MSKDPGKSVFGAIRDQEDKRDYPIKDYLIRTAPLPESIDYSYMLGPVRDQGSVGSCVGFACSEVKTGDEFIDLGEKLQFSPLFIYWQRPNQGSGMYPRDAMKILTEKGCCLEGLLPYDANKKETGEVPANTFKEAENFKIQAYARISTIDELRQTIVEYGPTYMSIPIFTSFDQTGSDGIVADPDPTKESLRGGHGICICGYDDVKKQFKFKNSWGPGWGQNGYGYLSYNFVEKFTWDIWQSVDAESKPITPVDRLTQLWIKIKTFFQKNPPALMFVIAVVVALLVKLFIIK